MSDLENQLSLQVQNLDFFVIAVAERLGMNRPSEVNHRVVSEIYKRVVDLVQIEKDLSEHRRGIHIMADFFDATKNYMRDESDKNYGSFVALQEPFKKAETVIKKLSPYKPISGNDADLIYWAECRCCGSVIGEDHSKEECNQPLSCPVEECITYRKDAYGEGKKYPYTFFTKTQIENDLGIAEFVKLQKSIGFH